MRDRRPPPPSLCVNNGTVEILTADRPDVALSMTEADAARALLAHAELLTACKRARKAIQVAIAGKGNMTNAYDEAAILAIDAAVAKAERSPS